jgi:hypothetical protein
LAQPIAKSGENEHTPLRHRDLTMRISPNAKATATEFATVSAPGVDEGITAARAALLVGKATKKDLAFAGIKAFAKSEAGKATGAKVNSLLGPLLDRAVKHQAINGNWGKLVEVANQGQLANHFVALAGKLGLSEQAARGLGTFAQGFVRTAGGKGGFESALRYATKASPTLVKILGRAGSLVPGVGLAASLVGAIRTFSDPKQTGAQKAAAVLNVIAGAAGVVPVIGTGVQVALGGAALAGGVAADAAAAKKAWTPQHA